MTIPEEPLAARRHAGYLVLRCLARDDHAEILLGFAEPRSHAPDDPALAPAVDEEPAMVALKTLPASAENGRRMLVVLEALERARGPHVVAVRDVDADDTVLCVVFERVVNGSLAELLTRREGLDAGEVVTIVAPVAAALQRMHAAGVAHGAVGARTVMFHSDGAPVLIGFGSASLFAPGAPEVVLERIAGVGADRRAVRQLAIALLGRVRGTRLRAARALLEELESCPEEWVLDMLPRRLFEVAAALPVRFQSGGEVDHDGEDAVASGQSGRVVPLGVPLELELELEPVAWVTGLASRVIPDAWVQRVQQALDAVDRSPLAPGLAGAARLWRGWSPVRRRLVLGGAIALVVVLGAVGILPAPSVSGADGTAQSTESPMASASGNSGTALRDARGMRGDDPLAAAAALAAARERCLRSLSVICLDGVDQADAGALRDDQATIRAAQQGGELPSPLVAAGGTLAPELVERLGDSALVRLVVAAPDASHPAREPASLLLVKGEAGWRIRDVISAPEASSGG